MEQLMTGSNSSPWDAAPASTSQLRAWRKTAHPTFTGPLVVQGGDNGNTGDFGVAQGWTWVQNCPEEAASTCHYGYSNGKRHQSTLSTLPALLWWEQSKISLYTALTLPLWGNLPRYHHPLFPMGNES